MVVGTPDKTLLLLLWGIVARNGRPSEVTFQELGQRIKNWHDAGVRVYPSDSADDLAEAIAVDADALATLGLIVIQGQSVALTAAGELLASTLELPDWAQNRLRQNKHVATSGA